MKYGDRHLFSAGISAPPGARHQTAKKGRLSPYFQNKFLESQKRFRSFYKFRNALSVLTPIKCRRTRKLDKRLLAVLTWYEEENWKNGRPKSCRIGTEDVGTRPCLEDYREQAPGKNSNILSYHNKLGGSRISGQKDSSRQHSP